jgi:hypothetical protein
MNKKEKVFRTVEEYQTIEVICNKCGKVHTAKDGGVIVDDSYKEPHSFTCAFGYYSGYDDEIWNFDLCETCLVDIIKTFKYAPSGFFTDRYTLARGNNHQKVFDYWKQTGEWEEYRFSSYEEILELKDLMNHTYINELIEKYYPDKPLISEEMGD